MRNTISTQQPLPSGLVVEVARWQVADMLKMEQASEEKISMMVDELFTECVVINDPRQIYGWAPGTKINGRMLLIGDRIALTMYQRMLSIPQGHKFLFEFPCESMACMKLERTSGCRIDLRRLLLPWVPADPKSDEAHEEAKKWGMGLTTVTKTNDKGEKVTHDAVVLERLGPEPIILGKDDLCYWRPLSEDAAEAFRSGNKVLFEDFDGNKVWWRQFVGEDAATMPIVDPANKNGPKDKAEQFIEVVRRRIVEVEGTERKNLYHWIAKEWGWGNADELISVIDEYECGIETEVSATCAHCKREQFTDAPLDSPLFFSRSANRKRRSARRSGRSS